MPYYDLKCTACKNEFYVKATVREREQNSIVCPACGSQKLVSVFKSMNYKMKTDIGAACPNSGACGASCPHARGA